MARVTGGRLSQGRDGTVEQFYTWRQVKPICLDFDCAVFLKFETIPKLYTTFLEAEHFMYTYNSYTNLTQAWELIYQRPLKLRKTAVEVTLLWGEELFLGWVIAGCFRPRRHPWLPSFIKGMSHRRIFMTSMEDFVGHVWWWRILWAMFGDWMWLEGRSDNVWYQSFKQKPLMV